MDYSTMSTEDLYELLTDDEKKLVYFFENYPEIDENNFYEITTKKGLFVQGFLKNDSIYSAKIQDLSALSFLNSFVNKRISEIKKRKPKNDALLKSQKEHIQLLRTQIGSLEKPIQKTISKIGNRKDQLRKVQIAYLKTLENPIISAIRFNNQPFAWYLAKKGFCSPIDPGDVFPQLINNKSDFIKILSVLPLKKVSLNELASRRIVRRLKEHPEEEALMMKTYNILKNKGFCDINQRSSFNWVPFVYLGSKLKFCHFRNGTFRSSSPLSTYMLHEAILQAPSIIPTLLKFEDLDINKPNDCFILGKKTWAGIDKSNLENPDPHNGNLPIMQILRWADPFHMLKQNRLYKSKFVDFEELDDNNIIETFKKYDLALSNKYIDEFIKRGAILDYKNKNGESVLMTAIHHGHTHGVEVCSHLIYPEILLDMKKLKGRSCWAEISPEICQILSAKFPSMQDAKQITYSQYLSKQEYYDSYCRIQNGFYNIATLRNLISLIDLLRKSVGVHKTIINTYGEESPEEIKFVAKEDEILQKYGLDKTPMNLYEHDRHHPEDVEESEYYGYDYSEYNRTSDYLCLLGRYKISTEGLEEYKNFIENEEKKMSKDAGCSK